MDAGRGTRTEVKMPSKFHVVQRQNKDGRLGLPVCQLDTSGAEWWLGHEISE